MAVDCISLLCLIYLIKVLGNYSEFRRVAQVLEQTLDFDVNLNVSVFESNIRGKRFSVFIAGTLLTKKIVRT